MVGDFIPATLQFPARVYYQESQRHCLELNDLSSVLVCTDDVSSFSGSVNKLECTEVATLYVNVGVEPCSRFVLQPRVSPVYAYYSLCEGESCNC